MITFLTFVRSLVLFETHSSGVGGYLGRDRGGRGLLRVKIVAGGMVWEDEVADDQISGNDTRLANPA